MRKAVVSAGRLRAGCTSRTLLHAAPPATAAAHRCWRAPSCPGGPGCPAPEQDGERGQGGCDCALPRNAFRLSLIRTTLAHLAALGPVVGEVGLAVRGGHLQGGAVDSVMKGAWPSQFGTPLPVGLRRLAAGTKARLAQRDGQRAAARQPLGWSATPRRPPAPAGSRGTPCAPHRPACCASRPRRAPRSCAEAGHSSTLSRRQRARCHTGASAARPVPGHARR